MNYRGCVCEGGIGKSVEFTLVFETESGRYAHLAPTASTSPRCTEPSCRLRGYCSCLLPNWSKSARRRECGDTTGQAGQFQTRTSVQGSRRAVWLLAGRSTHLRALERQIVRPSESAVGSFGGIMAFLLIRHLYRESGCWIVHDGDLRIERLSLKGTIEAITVGGDDVAHIDVESGGRRASHYAIAIRLHSGRKSAARCWSARTRPAPCRPRSPGDWGLMDGCGISAARLFRTRRRYNPHRGVIRYLPRSDAFFENRNSFSKEIFRPAKLATGGADVRRLGCGGVGPGAGAFRFHDVVPHRVPRLLDRKNSRAILRCWKRCGCGPGARSSSTCSTTG